MRPGGRLPGDLRRGPGRRRVRRHPGPRRGRRRRLHHPVRVRGGRGHERGRGPLRRLGHPRPLAPDPRRDPRPRRAAPVADGEAVPVASSTLALLTYDSEGVDCAAPVEWDCLAAAATGVTEIGLPDLDTAAGPLVLGAAARALLGEDFGIRDATEGDGPRPAHHPPRQRRPRLAWPSRRPSMVTQRGRFDGLVTTDGRGAPRPPATDRGEQDGLVVRAAGPRDHPRGGARPDRAGGVRRRRPPRRARSSDADRGRGPGRGRLGRPSRAQRRPPRPRPALRPPRGARPMSPGGHAAPRRPPGGSRTRRPPVRSATGLGTAPTTRRGSPPGRLVAGPRSGRPPTRRAPPTRSPPHEDRPIDAGRDRGPRRPGPAATGPGRLVAVALLAASCSGGGDDSADTKDAPPTSATPATASWSTWPSPRRRPPS